MSIQVNYVIMCRFTYVHIVNVEKRSHHIRAFGRIADAISFVKSFPRCKGCFIYALRYDEVIAIKSDLAPLQIYSRDENYLYDESFFQYEDNYSVLFRWCSSSSCPRFGGYNRCYCPKSFEREG